MNVSAKSSHPVMHIRSSGLPQPSLLPTMLDFDGGTTHGRAMGGQIFCTDCHNSDDNREFGRTGPNGPHGSKWWHLLERDYEDSQAPGGPGTLITVNLNPQPDLSVNGPYGMCAKCHSLSTVMQPDVVGLSQQSRRHRRPFLLHLPQRARHDIDQRNPTGVRMVDFDLNVVGRNGGLDISYDPGSNSCVLQCHSVAHDPGGGIRRMSGAQQTGPIKRR